MSVGTYRHEAVFYSGEPDFVEQIAPFVADGVGAGEPVLVVLEPEKIAALGDALGPGSDAVHFADMTTVGSNPARLIPVWRRFVEEHRDCGTPLRGVGEPIWATRTPDEVLECHQHESLLNVAFSDRDRLWLRCPYDVAELDPPIIERARRTHPSVTTGGASQPSATRDDGARWASLSGPPLPEAHDSAVSIRFDGASIATVRRFVLDRATDLNLDRQRAELLALASHEAASNSVRHGGGGGMVAIWRADHEVVCEVRDSGSIRDPLAGRLQPDGYQEGGRGLWIVNQLCDLSQVRSSAAGTTVRMRMHLPATVPTS